ncbi:MAG: RDD family protein [Acidimicrobiia bacterium]
MTNHYEVLGVAPDAPKDEIKTAYRERVERANKSGDTDTARDLNTAWHVLSDPNQRSRYDEQLADPDFAAAAEVESNATPVGKETRSAPPERKGLMGKLLGPPPERDAKVRPVAPDLGLANGAQPAPSARRMLGVVVDGFAYLVVLQLFVALFFRQVSTAGKNSRTSLIGYLGVGYYVALLASFSVVYLLFEVIPTRRSGQTVGRRLARVRVVDRATCQQISWRQSWIRAVVPLGIWLVAMVVAQPAAPIVVLGVVLWSTVDPGRQGLHDKVAKTIVIDVPRAPRVRPGAAGQQGTKAKR